MGKWKVCVYAICKNEAKFVRRWMDSMREADWVVVLDTGSDDGTPQMLRELGAQVTEEIITPWRFDVARNRSLELVPEEADICVCTDLDEVLRPGWRAALEAAWTENTRRARYRYTWNFNPDGSEGVVFWTDKIHARHGFRWVHPVHEVLEYERPDYETVLAEGVQLDHRADPTKSRAQYLPLLELSVREAPLDDRNTHYLGREYMFHRRWKECIETLTRHLALPTATWPDERCASMRFIARAHEALGNVREAEKWLYRAVGEAPHLREPWVEMAALCYRRRDWEGTAFFALRALDIQERPKTYICEASAWGSLPYRSRFAGALRDGPRARGHPAFGKGRGTGTIQRTAAGKPAPDARGKDEGDKQTGRRSAFAAPNACDSRITALSAKCSQRPLVTDPVWSTHGQVIRLPLARASRTARRR